MERYSVRDRERGKKRQTNAQVEDTVSPGTGNEEVSLFQLYPTSAAPPGRLNTRLFSACREEVPQKEGESGKDRVRVTRTTPL